MESHTITNQEYHDLIQELIELGRLSSGASALPVVTAPAIPAPAAPEVPAPATSATPAVTTPATFATPTIPAAFATTPVGPAPSTTPSVPASSPATRVDPIPAPVDATPSTTGASTQRSHCRHCGLVLPLASLRKHLKHCTGMSASTSRPIGSDGLRVYECAFCGASLNSIYLRNRHQNSCKKNPNKKVFRCTICKKEYSRQDRLNNHKCQVNCQHCNKPFDSPLLMLVHEDKCNGRKKAQA